MLKKNNKEDQNNKNYFLSFGIGFGLLAGVLFASFSGIFIESPLSSTFIWGLGPGLGMLIGIVIGSLMDYKQNKD